jgi:hypothetical protein
LSALKAVLFMIRSYAYFSILRMAFLLICHVKSQKPVSKFAYIKKNMYLCTHGCRKKLRRKENSEKDCGLDEDLTLKYQSRK